MIEIRHLRTLVTLRECGNLARAAEQLGVTQSALSYQLKALEEQYGTQLFRRKGRGPRFTAAGLRLLSLADEVLPLVDSAERELRNLQAGSEGRLHIAVECHSCFEWLMPTMDRYREQWPTVEMDLTTGHSFDPLPGLRRGDVDLVITSDPYPFKDIRYRALFRYQIYLVLPVDHALIEQEWIEPGDLRRETLITYPVERKRLDLFTRFLQPAGIVPAAVRTAALPAMILQLVASRRGITALPEWVLTEYLGRRAVAVRPLGRDGLWSTLYAGYRLEADERTYMDEFIETAIRTCHENLDGIRPTEPTDSGI